jgi:hypothetical protein
MLSFYLSTSTPFSTVARGGRKTAVQDPLHLLRPVIPARGRQPSMKEERPGSLSGFQAVHFVTNHDALHEKAPSLAACSGRLITGDYTAPERPTRR